jgi:hypothetical protein
MLEKRAIPSDQRRRFAAMRRVPLSRRVCLLGIAVFALAALCLSRSSVSAAKPPSQVSVSVRFGNAPSDHLISDYPRDYLDGQERVTAHINQISGDFELLVSNSQRKMFIQNTLADTAYAVDPTVAVASIGGEAISLNVGIGPGNLLTMPTDGLWYDMGAFLLTDNDLLRFQPWVDLGPLGNASTMVQVRVTGTDPAGKPIEWEIRATPGPPLRDLAVLVKPVRSGGRSVPRPAGYFHLPFSMTVTRLP